VHVFCQAPAGPCAVFGARRERAGHHAPIRINHNKDPAA
jgi:hypothetical protein